jgi:hypothetical protein
MDFGGTASYISPPAVVLILLKVNSHDLLAEFIETNPSSS